MVFRLIRQHNTFDVVNLEPFGGRDDVKKGRSDAKSGLFFRVEHHLAEEVRKQPVLLVEEVAEVGGLPEA